MFKPSLSAVALRLIFEVTRVSVGHVPCAFLKSLLVVKVVKCYSSACTGRDGVKTLYYRMYGA
jgi:hypothetical protein